MVKALFVCLVHGAHKVVAVRHLDREVVCLDHIVNFYLLFRPTLLV